MESQPESKSAPEGSVISSSISLLPPPSTKAKQRTNQLCQILLKQGAITSQDVRKALKIQEEHGGQVGRILVALGACSENAISRALLEQVRLRGAEVKNVSKLARDNPHVAGLRVECSPFRTTLLLVVTDAVAILLGFLVAFALQLVRDWTFYRETFFLLVASSVLCLVIFPGIGMYSAMTHSPPDEIRSSTFAVFISLMGVAAVALFGEQASRLWTLFSLVAWFVVVALLVPLFRGIVRMQFARRSWFGHPVVILGAAKTGRLIVRTLRDQPGRGLKPVALLDDDPAKQGTLRASANMDELAVHSVRMDANELIRGSMLSVEPDGSMAGSLSSQSLLDLLNSQVPSANTSSNSLLAAAGLHPSDMPPPSSEPVPISAPMETRAPAMFAEVDGVPLVGDLSLAPILGKKLGVSYAICAMPGLEAKRLLYIAERCGSAFPHMLIIPDLFGLGSIGVPAKDVGGILGIEVRQQLLLPGPRFVKRLLDLTLTIFGGICIAPFLLLLALLIIVDSRGGALYKQKRLGRDGSTFYAYKFRTMHGDGEARLQSILASDPKLRAEYDKYHKLRNDPRVTRVGRVLRKFSFDEFPQLWNVLRGDMSLVGPRPYLERELREMDAQEGIILRAPPGMTGLWQVSDRNAINFQGRVKMDVHYVRNWSPWLDLYILARTFSVVVRGTGM
jgi:lipopolysaccharide/colanic/teichoic acid biosynthesis glycosyltransferase